MLYSFNSPVSLAEYILFLSFLQIEVIYPLQTKVELTHKPNLISYNLI